MELAERLEGERILLSALAVEDAPFLFERCWSSPAVMRYQDFPLHQALHDSVGRIHYLRQQWHAGLEYNFALQVKGYGVAGTFRCRPGARDTRLAFGFSLAEALWGRGYMAEALALMQRQVLETTRGPVPGVAVCHHANRNAAALLRRSGFVCAGSFHASGSFPNLAGETLACIDRYEVHWEYWE